MNRKNFTLRPQDYNERQHALDPARSFIVQAPAGSGKTTLLTKRYLALLEIVDSPEEILAITFTKKAANEMRQRVLAELSQKKSNFAQNPQRLHIQTIDSFCFTLAFQMPLLANFGGITNIADDFSVFYLEAARETITQLDHSEWGGAIQRLLLHLDNRANLLETLLVDMLVKRDQWMEYLSQHDENLFRNGLEAIAKDAVEKCQKTIPKEFKNEIIQLKEYSSQNLSLQKTNFDSVDYWIEIAELILTKGDALRKGATKNIGFPAVTSAKNSAEKVAFANMKLRFENLMLELDNYDEFIEALIALRFAPKLDYGADQKQILNDLLIVLPVAVANLKIIFGRANVVDYIEIAQAASRALGGENNPTDLALILDRKIKHILVDEFQDTSISQFKLLEKLTTGWEQNDGRTLFCVGDPMQSIYKFRSAEVGLFLRAQNEGINQIKLDKITLVTNFRSDQKVISWVNSTFNNIFPKTEDIAAGAVSYSSAVAFGENDLGVEKDAVIFHSAVSAENEAEKISEIIMQKPKSDSLAILVKARSHLEKIITLLKQKNIPFHAVEIESLANKPIILDLFSLTKALLDHADRIAWLSVLRAPWCGLTLNDLLVIAKTDETTIWQNMLNEENYKNLSADGAKRVKFIRAVFQGAFHDRFEMSLRDWIESVWKKLLPHTVTEKYKAEERAALRQFFTLIENYAEGGAIKNPNQIEEKIATIYASSTSNEENAVQVMTIHKAKGLEFDIVVVPGLERESKSQESQLLKWMERPRTHFENDLILAPIKAYKDKNHDSVYSYLTFEEKQKTKFENQRLLYVAATRAKKQLHFLATISSPEFAPKKNSFLKMLWPQFVTSSNCASEVVFKKEENFLTRIRTENIADNFKAKTRRQENFLKTEIKLSDSLAQDIGTIVHSILEQIATEGLENWDHNRVLAAKSAWRKLFLQLGQTPENASIAVEKIIQAISNIINDEKGRWILSSHQDAQSELPVTFLNGNKTENYIIDRTFIADNTRWIIDFKTTEFIDPNQHQNQLNTYKKIFRALKKESYPIKLALYFPMIPKWIELM